MRGLVLLMACVGAAWAAAPPDRAAFERAEVLARLGAAEDDAIKRFNARKLADPERVFVGLVRAYEKACPARDYPNGTPHLAEAVLRVAMMHVAAGRPVQADPYFRRAVAMREALYQEGRWGEARGGLVYALAKAARHLDGRGYKDEARKLYLRHLRLSEEAYKERPTPTAAGNIAGTLLYLGAMHAGQGEHWRAEPLFRRSLAMMQRKYPAETHPKGHLDLVRIRQELAEAQTARGDYAAALANFKRAAYMCIDLGRGPDEWLAVSAYKWGAACRLVGDLGRAETLAAMALQAYEKIDAARPGPVTKGGMAAVLNTLSVIHEAQGEPSRAEACARRSLTIAEGMARVGDPHGGARIRVALNNLAMACAAAGKAEEAALHYRRALEVAQRTFTKFRHPDGHPELLGSISNLATHLRRKKADGEEEALTLRALAMARRLYPASRLPQGHPNLLLMINNAGALYRERGDRAAGRRLYDHALDMAAALYPPSRYPEGHPDLARALFNLGSACLADGDAGRAARLLRRALHTYEDYAVRNALHSGEATALNQIGALPGVLDLYLDAAAKAGEDAHPEAWRVKAAVFRVMEQRRRTLAAADADARRRWETLAARRREREALLLTPADGPGGEERRARIAELEEETRRLERELLNTAHGLEKPANTSTPSDLRKALPAGAAFVDFLRYRPLNGPARYVAFVVTRRGAARVELGEAKPVEETLSLWRRAIAEGADAEAKYASEMHRLVWAPLARHLPAGATEVLVSPDGALHRAPWAALRDGATGRILIEGHAVGVVPHGPALLARLAEGRKPGHGAVLAVGGVSYGGRAGRAELPGLRAPAGDATLWGDLPGTAAEAAQVKALAGRREVVALSGTGASLPGLLAALPKAGHAHLATHGYFAGPGFRSMLRLDERLFERGARGERAAAGARSPLLLSGLVCAGANLPGTPNRGVLTAEAVLALDLRKLDLAVLSACETGLGEVAGGEGVFGLVRAFHVAGARDVIATQWKVPDRATAALMDRFYRRLWGATPVSPLEALRLAQLDIYRNPAMIPEWAASRGPLPYPVKGTGPAAVSPLPAGKGSPARDWAAFLLSGAGR